MTFNLGRYWAAVPRLGFSIGLGLLAGAVNLGCAHVPKAGDDQIPVSLGDWCKEVNGKLCNSVAQSCFKSMTGFSDGCLQAAMPSCLDGRSESSASGRNKGELSACVAAIQPLSCKELGQGLGSGKLAAICGAKGSGSTPPSSDAAKPAAGESAKPAGESAKPAAGEPAKPPAEGTKTTPPAK